jgi:CO/xanthine dehydrogenase Mo-binding subunit
VGTFASRGAVVAGNATHAAAKQVRAKILRTAAEHFECAGRRSLLSDLRWLGLRPPSALLFGLLEAKHSKGSTNSAER